MMNDELWCPTGSCLTPAAISLLTRETNTKYVFFSHEDTRRYTKKHEERGKCLRVFVSWWQKFSSSPATVCCHEELP